MSRKGKHIKKYENELTDLDTDFEDLNFEALANTEIRLNPSFYHHVNLLQAQKSLVADDVKAGIMQYFVNAEHMETLCAASGNLPEDYEEQVKNIDKVSGTTDIIKMAQAANKKYRLLVSHLFGNVQKRGTVAVRKKDLE